MTAGGRNVGVIPLGEWVHVDIGLELGEGKPKTYHFKLTVPGREPIVAEIPYRSETFEKITWLGCVKQRQLQKPSSIWII